MSKRLLIGVVALVVGVVALVAIVGLWLNGLRNRVEVNQAVRTAPGTVALSVNSCNQRPFIHELDQTVPGTYEVTVKTALRDSGDACADGLSIEVDPSRDTITIIDRVSGRTFDLLGSGQPFPLGLNGTWQMVTVDIGNEVTIGRTTAETPVITISANEGSGVVAGNFGCNDGSIDVTFTGDTIIGQPETLEAEQEFCAIPDGSDELVLTERTLLELLSGEPAQVTLIGDQLEIGTLQTNAVFERISSPTHSGG